jgi:CDP-diacylglycerol--glycerol-3-phosphate 3-phosphatidyltransferase
MVMVPAIIVLFICDAWPQHVHGLSPYIATFKIDGEQYGFTVLFLIAGALFVIASFTDFLDGYLSRKYH